MLTVAQAAGSFVGPGTAVKVAGALARGVGAGASAATKAGRAASVIPAIVGGLGGAFGAENLLAGAKGFAGGAAARALKTGASEVLQEGIEEGVTQYEGQRAAMPYDSTIDPMKGVAGAAAMGAVMGAGTGGVVGALEGGHYTDLPKPTADATADVSNPRAGFMNGIEASPRVDYLADVQNAIRGGTEFSTQQTVDTVRNAMEDAWLAQNVGDSESAQVDAGVAGMQAAEAVGQQLQTEFDQAGEGASIAAVDARLRTTRILEGLQNILDSGVDNSQQVSARLNESLARINEEPLQPEEVVRVRRMTDSFKGFKGVGQTAPLPTTAPKYVDENADNGAMEALIPERKSKSMGLRHEASYLELMHRMWNQGGKEGKRAVAWSMVGLLLMGGAGGLPFMEDLEDLVDGIAQLMGYNVNAMQWRKEAMRDVVGKEMAEFVEQGLSGLPGAPIDVSGRLGLGNLIPGTGLFLSKPNRERDLLEVVGPAGDLISRGFSGARKLVTGDW